MNTVRVIKVILKLPSILIVFKTCEMFLGIIFFQNDLKYCSNSKDHSKSPNFREFLEITAKVLHSPNTAV